MNLDIQFPRPDGSIRIYGRLSPLIIEDVVVFEKSSLATDDIPIEQTVGNPLEERIRYRDPEIRGIIVAIDQPKQDDWEICEVLWPDGRLESIKRFRLECVHRGKND